MLHTLSSSPWQCDIDQIIRMIKIDDDLLLIQDGVFGAIKDSRFVEILTDASATVSALKEDIDARGIASQVSKKINVVDYVYFVDLIVKHTGQIRW